MTSTIFSRLSLDRKRSHWEEKLTALTPWEEKGGVWLKREDYFAPLGYGGINGSKLRQCIWLTTEYLARFHSKSHRPYVYPGMLSAASVKSPQLSMGALVARHFGLPCRLVLGATTMESAVKHENVAIAHAAGAEFEFIKVAYNPALQRAADALHQHPEYASYMRLEYGITVEGDDERIEAFHRLGSEQVKNLPPYVETLFVPMGSANSCASILYGIARFRPPKLRKVVLIGIGPTRLGWLEQRLAAVERVSGLRIRPLFHRTYVHHPALAQVHNHLHSEQRALGGPSSAYELVHHDLHAIGYVSYQDEMPYGFYGVELHPTYEGKVLTYLAKKRQEFPEFWAGDGKAGLWIVGSKPRLAPMVPHLLEAESTG